MEAAILCNSAIPVRALECRSGQKKWELYHIVIQLAKYSKKWRNICKSASRSITCMLFVRLRVQYRAGAYIFIFYKIQ